MYKRNKESAHKIPPVAAYQEILIAMQKLYSASTLHVTAVLWLHAYKCDMQLAECLPWTLNGYIEGVSRRQIFERGSYSASLPLLSFCRVSVAAHLLVVVRLAAAHDVWFRDLWIR